MNRLYDKHILFAETCVECIVYNIGCNIMYLNHIASHVFMCKTLCDLSVSLNEVIYQTL